MSKVLKNRYCVWVCWLFLATGIGFAEEESGYDSEKGFSPVQANLTTAFLKLAVSLEAHGSPEPYIRHVLAEHERIDAKYRRVTEKSGSARPTYLTDEYLANLLGNWKRLEKPLRLDQLCRDCGRYMRHAIRGSWHKTGEDWALEEPNLKGEERAQFVELAGKDFFTKADFPLKEKFYADGGGWEKLSDSGKRRMSELFWRGTVPKEKLKEELARYEGGTSVVGMLNGYQERLVANINDGGKREVTSETLGQMLVWHLSLGAKDPEISKLEWHEKDAVRYAHLIKRALEKRFAYVRTKLAAEKSQEIEKGVLIMARNLAAFVYWEFELALREKSLLR